IHVIEFTDIGDRLILVAMFACRRLLLYCRRLATGTTTTGGGSTALRPGPAFLVEFDEFIFARRHFRAGGATSNDRIGDGGAGQLDSAHGVVVAGDDELQIVWSTVR